MSTATLKRPGNFKDITGQRFSMLTAVRYFSKGKNWRSLWLFRCDCGKEVVKFRSNVVGGQTHSCGCDTRRLISASNTEHGHKPANAKASPEYRTWTAMLSRCRNPNRHQYCDYGGRGIKVCDRWLDFKNFLADMGPKPSAKHSIDRIDNDGDYCHANCRWATRLEQGRNRRKKVTI